MLECPRGSGVTERNVDFFRWYPRTWWVAIPSNKGPGAQAHTVDGKNLATPGAPGVQHFIKILVFGGVEGSGGAWGHHQSTRDEKIPWASYFREFGLEL